MDASLAKAGAELICLAGFMRILGDTFVRKWQGRLVNIHPSLLPSFKGMAVHEQAIAAGVRISGCTVHYVIWELDSGPAIAQAAVAVRDDDTAESLASRVLQAEHRLYPSALRLIAEGRVRLSAVFRDCPRTARCKIHAIRPLFVHGPQTRNNQARACFETHSCLILRSAKRRSREGRRCYHRARGGWRWRGQARPW